MRSGRSTSRSPSPTPRGAAGKKKKGHAHVRANSTLGKINNFNEKLEGILFYQKDEKSISEVN